MGITGPWGSGKSSILNLLQERIKRECSDALVVRFDPWLISGRDNLVSAFIRELLGAINADSKAAKLLKSTTATIAKYGERLAPAVNLFIPGAGSAIAGGAGALNARFSPDESLTALRAKLSGG